MVLIVATPNEAAEGLIEDLLASLLDLASGAPFVWLNLMPAGHGDKAIRSPRSSAIRTGEPCVPSAEVLRRIQAFPKWQTILPSLRAGRCPILPVPGGHSSPARARRGSAAAFSILACPATTPAGDILGAVFIGWDDADARPDDAELAELMRVGKRIGGQIAATLELCAHAAACLECSAAA